MQNTTKEILQKKLPEKPQICTIKYILFEFSWLQGQIQLLKVPTN